MFINNAFALDGVPASTGASIAGTFIQILLIFLVFYILLIRPQQKKLKQREADLNAIKIGDKVLTGGGLYGIVRAVKDEEITLEISKGVDVTANRWTIRDVIKDKVETSAPKKSKNKGKKNV